MPDSRLNAANASSVTLTDTTKDAKIVALFVAANNRLPPGFSHFRAVFAQASGLVPRAVLRAYRLKAGDWLDVAEAVERKLNPPRQSAYFPLGWTPTASAEPKQPKRLPVDPITRKIAALEAAVEAERRQQAAEMRAALAGTPSGTPPAKSADAKSAVTVAAPLFVDNLEQKPRARK